MRTITLIFLFFISLHSYAIDNDKQNKQTPDERCNDPSSEIECGWHYGYIDPFGELETPKEIVTPPVKEKAPEPESEPEQQEPKEKKERCTKMSNWDESCGFIDPGTDYEFQSKQRDIFLQGLLMKSGDPEAVKNMQKYQRWMINKAVEASKVWEFNLVQDPTLSASTKAPVASYAIHAATQIRENTTAGVINEVNQQGGYYVWFTRSDCQFCHHQLKMVNKLSLKGSLKIRNVSLDEECMPGYEEDCIRAPISIVPAKELGVQIVPSFFLYLPKDDTWIRVSNGLESLNTINTRVKNFFLAIKSAAINGTNNGSGTTPSVDFSEKNSLHPTGIKEIK